MTALRSVERRYDALTADERFRLAAAARARGDVADEDALDRTCPRVALTGADLAYAHRWAALGDVMNGLVRVLLVLRERDRSHAAALRALDASAGMMVNIAEWGYNAGWAAARGVTLPELDPYTPGTWAADVGLADAYRRAIQAVAGDVQPAHLAELAAVWRAWCDWSGDVTGADGGPLLAEVAGDDLAAWAIDAVGRAGEPDPATVAEARAALEGVWRQRAPGA